MCAYKPPRTTLAEVDAALGASFTGMGNAEQDGRYVSGFTTQMNRPSGGGAHPDRALAMAARGDELQRSFLQFSRHFQKMSDDLGSRLDSVNTLWFPHHLAKTGLYTALGAEIAQSLPNAPIRARPSPVMPFSHGNFSVTVAQSQAAIRILMISLLSQCTS